MREDSPMKDKIAEVAFPLPLLSSFDYLIPEALRGKIKRGMRVVAPLSGKPEFGFVLRVKEESSIPKSELKEIEELLDDEPLLPSHLIELALEGAKRYFGSLGLYLKSALPELLSRRSTPRYSLSEEGRRRLSSGKIREREGEILAIIGEKELSLRTLRQRFKGKTIDHYLAKLKREGLIECRYPITARRAGKQEEEKPLEKKEKKAPLAENIFKKRKPLLLLGTKKKRRGKYLELVEDIISQGKGVLILLPEISLPFFSLLSSRFGKLVSLITVRLTPKQYLDEWLKIKDGKRRIVIGARTALFAPIPDLGLIIVDDEEDQAHYREETPRYNVRELALIRGELEGVPVVLGSFFPSFESYFRAEKGEFTLLKLEGETPPRIELIDMTSEFKKRGRKILSEPLIARMKECPGKIILILDRKGYASFLMCRACGFIPRCPNCSVSLTYHKKDGVLRCHYCGEEKAPLKVCPECGERFIHYLGEGTEKLMGEVEKLFSGRNIIRVDTDVVKKPEDIERVWEEMKNLPVPPIIVGTRLALREEFAEGAELIAFLNPDPALNQPHFRAGERALQLIGKGACQAKEVFIETYHPKHYVMKSASSLDWESFYEEEKALRRVMRYPPFSRLISIVISGKGEDHTLKKAERLASTMRGKRGKKVVILGPARAGLFRLRGRFRYQIILKGEEEEIRSLLLSTLRKTKIPPADLSIEVDPERLL